MQPARVLCIAIILALQSHAVAKNSSPPSTIPADSAQERATSLIHEVYGDAYASAKTAEQKSALSQKMIQKALETKDDQSVRYVLFRTALDLATSAGDVDLAFAAIDQMATFYGIAARQVKSEIIAQVSRAARSPERHEAVAIRAALLMDEFTAVDLFKEASELGRLALNSARSSKNASLSKRITASIKEMQEVAKVYEAIPVFDANTTDPRTSVSVGKYLCFYKGDWGNGLPLLAAGSDERLKDLAAMELQQPSTVDRQVALGDAWWDLSVDCDNGLGERCRKRAGYWYLKSAPELKGVTRDRVKQRLAKLLPTTYFIHFASPESLDRFVVENSDGCRLNGHSLQISKAYITYRTYFDSISSVKIRGGTDSLNFRVSVGMVNMILNWEGDNHNRFWYIEKKQPGRQPDRITRPMALRPGAIHEIGVAQLGSDVVVTIDGVKHFATKGRLFGTVGIYQTGPSSVPPSTLTIHSIEIDGVADPTAKVTGPSHKNRY